jgi:hypothetical protein
MIGTMDDFANVLVLALVIAAAIGWLMGLGRGDW